MEALVSLGVLMLLLALVMPLLSSVVQRARRTRCEAQLRSHLTVLGAYAGDHRDMWPFPLDASGRPTLETGLSHADLSLSGGPHDYGRASVGAGLWHMPVLDAYNEDPFHESLLCPMDRETLAERDRFAAAHGRSPTDVRGTLAYQMSMALMLDPTALDPGSPSREPRHLRGVTHAEVLHPSYKGSVYELVPFHEKRYRADPHIVPPYRLVMGACDGSVRYRASDECSPGVVYDADGLEGELRARIAALHAVMYTANGARGRDW